MSEVHSESVNVIRIEAESRFEIYVDGEEAGFLDYFDEGGIRVMPHTVVHSRFEGRGLAKVLTKHALTETRAEGFKVLPQCSYVRVFLEKNPEFAELDATSV